MRPAKHLFVLVVTMLFCLFTGPGCGDHDRSLARIDQLSKDYCSFSTGSYWVYQKVASNIFDTVSIYLVEKNIISIPEYASFDFEEIRMHTIWSSFGHDPGQSTVIEISGDLDWEEDISLVEEQTPWFYGPNLIFIPLKTIGESISYYQYDTIRLSEKLDSLIIGDSTYRDILVFQTTAAFHPTKHEYSYWAKNVGRIRFMNFNGEVWDLLAHNAIQNQ